ncbi:MAG: glycoside hydrolase family 99-like domain-containing protein, partial [Chromatiaceae bacterium]|nr:glycoside hydrolase family 99-like domain-containing protein [Chromatiaceae bacterium]
MHDAPGEDVEAVELYEGAPLASPPARLIAFYLPQFHPIPENDAWWGRGFTEWTNVIRGKPRFEGHHQPHLPGELGFYDLRVPAVQHRQVELAKLYGLSGFAFYFYWFGGKRLLEAPLLQFMEDDSLDFPFCLCWANENWSRRWDGRDQDLLIQQRHSPADDLAFIAYISKYLRDRRCIRVGGRPLLILYRPDLLPDARATAERWRTWARENGIGELYLAYAQSFESTDPGDYGLDAAIEFPPNNTNPPIITDRVESLEKGFQGILFDWSVFPRRSRDYQPADYPIFRGVNPSWDNEARRPGCGAVFVGSSPRGYREWLENAIRDTVARSAESSARLIFVNAWNEWAEGAHLEPDQRYGYAYLQATRDALLSARFHLRRRLLVVSHDAHANGAQYLSLNIAKELRDHLGYQVEMVVLGGGALLGDYENVATLHLLEGAPADGSRARKLARELRKSGITDAIVNSTASGLFTRPLHQAGIRVISLIHELPGIIRNHGLQIHAQTIAECADLIVFPAPVVQDGFAQFATLGDEKILIRTQGLYKRNAKHSEAARKKARQELRNRLGLTPYAEIVIGVGYADLRKGFDLFIEAGIKACKSREHLSFVWIGNLDPALERRALERITEAGMLSRFFFPGHESQTDVFYSGADIYAMTSREDPFPTVIMEALEVGVPVVGFANAGGLDTLADEGCVKLIPAFDTSAFAESLTEILADSRWRQKAGAAGRALISREFGFRRYLFDVLSKTTEPPPTISVIVPNYNYRRYLPDRLASITGQTIPVYEVIVLDDASTDGSREWLETELQDLVPEARIVINDTNSGSVFRQWLKGVELARGDFVWIAEADDLAAPEFLQMAMEGFNEPAVVISYTQSKQIDSNGKLLSEHYLDYVADVSERRWKQGYIKAGATEIGEALAIKNTIPNVSGVLFRRDPLVSVLREQLDTLVRYRVAGDWVAYIALLRRGQIAFNAEALNLHRRHDAGVTISAFDRSQLAEIMSVQKLVRDHFDIDPEVRARATAYAQSLYDQFGLATAQYPMVD